MTKNRNDYFTEYRKKNRTRLRVYKSIWRNKNRKKIRDYDTHYRKLHAKVGSGDSVVK